MVQAAFVRVVDAPDGVDPEETGRRRYVVECDRHGETSTYPVVFDAIVNCAGFSPTHETSESTFVGRLSSAGLCTPTASGCGLQVDESMSSAPDVFVIGPLLAGNILNGSPIWHMEHCGRIARFGKQLGTTLTSRLSVPG